MSDVTQQIKDRLDIADFLKSYIQLHPAGKNLKALCPFHKEKTPSFMVSPERQSWHCFGGCNEGGDVFKFLMKYENLEFYEALKVLAEKTGVDLRKYGAGSGHRQYEILYEINGAAKDFFKKNLNQEAFDYFFNRGLKKETIEEFDLGFASSSGDQLFRHLVAVGFSPPEIEKAGLALRTERGTYWDRFRQRLMFPICNNFGKAVGFTGRVLRDEVDQAKYVNSPETAIFNKSKLLYGFYQSKNFIREKKEVVLVEGQMDFLMAYQDGVKNSVAVSGTALTLDHLKTLKRLADKLIIGFDNDEAGQLAVERAIDLAAASDFMVSVVRLADSKDLADAVKESPGSACGLIGQAQSAMGFYFNRYPIIGVEPAKHKANIRIILAKINSIFSKVEQHNWLKELANTTGIKEEMLIEELSNMPQKVFSPYAAKKPVEAPPEAENYSRRQLIAQRIVDLGGVLPEGIVLPEASLIQLALKASLENSNLDPDKKEGELRALARELRLDVLKEKLQNIQKNVDRAEKEGDDLSLIQSLKDFDIISKEFHNIETYGKGQK